MIKARRHQVAGRAQDGDQGLVASRSKVLNWSDPKHVRLAAAWYLESTSSGVSVEDGESRPLVQLDLHMCRLKTFGQLAFDEGHAYVFLDASLNYLTEAPAEVEQHGRELRWLDLSLNQIAEAPQLRLPKLCVLNLARNSLTSLRPDCLEHLSNLRELDLSHNSLSCLPELPGLERLSTLNLRGNRLEIVQGLERLCGLRTLNVASNQLTDILQLADATSLTTLDLSGNLLDDLMEVRDVLLCLTQLTELKLLQNPIAEERNYRMSILSNPSVDKLDNFKVTKGVRAQWKETKTQADLDNIVAETSTHYMRWIEREGRQKQLAIATLRKREDDIEAAFSQYKETMEAELEDCIRYIQELSENPGAYDESFLSSLDGHAKWQGYLARAEAARKETYDAEMRKMTSDMTQHVMVKAETEQYVAKLRVLSEQRRSVWQEIKEKETAFRASEEQIEQKQHDIAASERDEAHARIVERAQNRNQLLLQAAADMDVRLRNDDPDDDPDDNKR